MGKHLISHLGKYYFGTTDAYLRLCGEDHDLGYEQLSERELELYKYAFDLGRKRKVPYRPEFEKRSDKERELFTYGFNLGKNHDSEKLKQQKRSDL